MSYGYLQQRTELITLACSIGAQLGLPGGRRHLAALRPACPPARAWPASPGGVAGIQPLRLLLTESVL